MKKFKQTFLLFAFLVITAPSVLGQQHRESLLAIIEQIKNAPNVERLYSIRANLGKVAANKELSVQDQQLLAAAYRTLAQSFKSSNHFRNAADVYKNYLDINEQYLKNQNAYLVDSLKLAFQQTTTKEQQQISELDGTIRELTQTKEAVGGLKQKYYSIGTIAAIGIVVLFLVIFISRNRAIRLTRKGLSENQNRMIALNSAVSEATMVTGSIAFSEALVAQQQEIVEQLKSNLKEDPDKKMFEKDLQALEKIQKLLSNTKA